MYRETRRLTSFTALERHCRRRRRALHDSILYWLERATVIKYNFGTIVNAGCRAGPLQQLSLLLVVDCVACRSEWHQSVAGSDVGVRCRCHNVRGH